MHTFTSVDEIAAYERLEKITTTEGMNGYPQGLNNRHVIGFDDMAKALEFIAEYGGTLTLYRKRDGHHFWENRGRTHQTNVLTADDYVKDKGDNYSLVHGDDDKEFWFELVTEKADDKDWDGLVKLVKEIENTREAIENCPDHQITMVSGTRFIEYVDLEMMSYHEDCWTHAIGVDMSDVNLNPDNETENS